MFKLLILNIAVLAITLSTDIPEGETWMAPASANELVNPVKDDPSATTRGKKTFQSTCTVCHGSTGKGDGMVGASLNPPAANLQLPIVAKQTDGAIFWKISTGNSPMPSYKINLTDRQKWELVNYIRTLQNN